MSGMDVRGQHSFVKSEIKNTSSALTGYAIKDAAGNAISVAADERVIIYRMDFSSAVAGLVKILGNSTQATIPYRVAAAGTAVIMDMDLRLAVGSVPKITTDITGEHDIQIWYAIEKTTTTRSHTS